MVRCLVPLGDTDNMIGRCDRCDWQAVAGSHTAMVKLYQEHLRESHPKIWLRT